MSNPFGLPKPPYRFRQDTGWTGGQAAAPERLEQTLRDWLNLQRDFAAAYTRWLEQLRECRSPADFMHAQQSGFALWTQWIGTAMSALANEATTTAELAATELTGTLKPASAALPPAASSPAVSLPAASSTVDESPPKAPHKRAKAPRAPAS